MATVVNLNAEDFENVLQEQYNIDDIEDSRYGDDDDESLGSVIDAGMRTVGNIVGGGVNAARNVAGSVLGGIGSILGVNPSPASTAGIQGSSNLSGTLQTNTGKQIPFRLPGNIATKSDVDVIRGAISKLNAELKTLADAGNNNAAALTKLTKEVAAVDSKHVNATKTQNKYISKLGNSIDKVNRDLRNIRSQMQMQSMFSMMMQPQLSSITFKTDPVANSATEVTENKYSSGNDMLMMALMMGGMGGNNGGSDGDNFMNNPLAILALSGQGGL